MQIKFCKIKNKIISAIILPSLLTKLDNKMKLFK